MTGVYQDLSRTDRNRKQLLPGERFLISRAWLSVKIRGRKQIVFLRATLLLLSPAASPSIPRHRGRVALKTSYATFAWRRRNEWKGRGGMGRLHKSEIGVKGCRRRIAGIKTWTSAPVANRDVMTFRWTLPIINCVRCQLLRASLGARCRCALERHGWPRRRYATGMRCGVLHRK